MQTNEEWMTIAYMAGATMEEVADVITLATLLDRQCFEIKNAIVDGQITARRGAIAHSRKFKKDLERLAGEKLPEGMEISMRGENLSIRPIETFPEDPRAPE